MMQNGTASYTCVEVLEEWSSLKTLDINAKASLLINFMLRAIVPIHVLDCSIRVYQSIQVYILMRGASCFLLPVSIIYCLLVNIFNVVLIDFM